MSKLALQRIRENIEKHRRGEDARMLDLGNCGMTGGVRSPALDRAKQRRKKVLDALKMGR
jgi:hypothetical protein